MRPLRFSAYFIPRPLDGRVWGATAIKIVLPFLSIPLPILSLLCRHQHSRGPYPFELKRRKR